MKRLIVFTFSLLIAFSVFAEDSGFPPVTVIEGDEVQREKKAAIESDVQKAAISRIGTKLDMFEERLIGLMGKMEEMEQRLKISIKEHMTSLEATLQKHHEKPQKNEQNKTAFVNGTSSQTEEAKSIPEQELSLSVEMSKMSPEEAYQKARSFVSAGDYDKAIEALEIFLEIYKDNPLAQAALYWIAETHFAKKQYAEASKKFLHSYQNDPKGNKAPDALLKLGISMSRLDKKMEACAVFKKIKDEFPKMSENLNNTLQKEQKTLLCHEHPNETKTAPIAQDIKKQEVKKETKEIKKESKDAKKEQKGKKK